VAVVILADDSERRRRPADTGSGAAD
jgi:hypothetical protein